MAIGIIAEYNPFHNGHLYHLNQIKKKFPNEPIILVTNSYFTQRGDISLLTKYNKTLLALELGIDLIVELPFPFATQSADFFAKGSIKILKELKVDKLIFGSEANDIAMLTKAADIELYDNEYNEKVKIYLNNNVNYPTALSKALEEYINYKIASPNDLLALSYIKAIKLQHAKITPLAIKRTNDYHDLTLKDNIASASSIRKALQNKQDITNYVPKLTKQYLTNYHFIDDYYNLLKYKIITDNNLNIYQTVDEGIENRLKKYINSCQTLDELIEKVKTKRYTYNKIKRMLVHILCNFTKQEAKEFQELSYIRILGFNNNGQAYLNKIKKDLDINIITTISKSKDKMLLKELMITNIYSTILPIKIQKQLLTEEYSKFPIIYKK